MTNLDLARATVAARLRKEAATALAAAEATERGEQDGWAVKHEIARLEREAGK